MMRFGCPFTDQAPVAEQDVTYFERRMLAAADLIERELTKLRVNSPVSVPKVHVPLNPDSEAPRLMFVINRDGLTEAVAYATKMKHIYLAAALATRKSSRSRNHPFRRQYIEAAFSLRCLLRRFKTIPELTKIIAVQLLMRREDVT